MPQESEHPADDSPIFHDAPIDAQPGTDPAASTPAPTETSHRDDPKLAELPAYGDPAPAAKDQARPASPAASKPSSDPMQGEAKQPSRPAIVSGAVMMLVGSAITIGTFFLARAYAPPRPAGETAENPPADMVKPDDFKKLADRVDKMATDVDQSKKQIADRPDYSSQMKMFNDRINELQQTVAQMGPQFNSINQKLDTLGKVEDANSSSRVDALSKRVDDFSHSLDALRANATPSPRGAGGAANSGRLDEANVQGLAMDQAVELFNAKKYSEARDAFTKLQSVFPNDARIWYYSALATGFATGKWVEPDRLAKIGLDKEKAGEPGSDKVDASFVNLAPESKVWLDAYRKRIGR